MLTPLNPERGGFKFQCSRAGLVRKRGLFKEEGAFQENMSNQTNMYAGTFLENKPVGTTLYIYIYIYTKIYIQKIMDSGLPTKIHRFIYEFMPY